MRDSSRWIVAGIAALVSLIGLTAPASADDCLPVLGRWSYGPTDTVEVSGSYAYFNSGSVLKIADVSNAAQPVVVGEIDIEDIIEDLVVSDGHAFVVSNGSRYLFAIDVRDPSDPRVVGRIQLSEGWWVVDAGLEVDGTMVYLGDHGKRIVAIDAADPRNPEVVGAYEPPPDSYGDAPELLGFAVGDGVVYVTANSSYFDRATLRVIDFSSPSSPVEIGRVENPYFSGARAVAASGQQVYLSASDGLHVIDVSDPETPVDVGLVAGHFGAVDLVSRDDRVFSAHYRGLRIYDVAEPSAPSYLAYGVGGKEVVDVALGDHVAFVAVGADGLQVLDLGQLSVMTEFGAIDTPGFARNLAIEGEIAYVADGSLGLRLIDVGQPDSPVEVGSMDTPGYAYAVAVVGGLAYVADRDEGVRIIDVGEPSSLVELGSVPGFAVDIDVKDEIALVADSSDGLIIVDIRNPSAPAEVAVMPLDGSVRGVRRDGNLAFVAVYRKGLRIIDITAPDAPLLIGSYDEDEIEGLAVNDGYAYLSTSRGLEIVDVRAPVSPVRTSRISVSNLEPGIEVLDGRAYLPAGRDGFHAYDVSDPTEPKHLGFCDTPGEVIAVRAAGGLAYLAASEEGLRVIDVGSPSLPPVVGGFETPGATEVIAAYENFVYVIKDTGLQVIRVTSSGRPVEVRFIELGFRPGSTALVEDGSLYLSVGNRDGIAIVSLANPGSPRLQGLIEQRVLSFDVENSAVYASVSSSGFVVFDATDPTSPVEVGRIDRTNSNFGQIAVSNGLAIAVNGRGVSLIDVSDPTHPHEVSRISEGDEWQIYAVGLANDIAVLAVGADPGGSMLRSYDVRDPSAPALVDSIGTYWPVRTVQFAGRRFVVGLVSHLVQVYDTMSPGVLKRVGDTLYFRSVETIAVADSQFHLALGPIGFVTHDLSLSCEAPRSSGGRVAGGQSP